MRLAFIAIALSACNEAVSPPPQPSIQIVPAVLNLFVGGNGRFTAVVLNAASATVNWTSSNGAVATVDQTGLVTAQAPGAATITASLAGNANIKQDVTVNVALPPAELILDSVRDPVSGHKLIGDTAAKTVYAHFTVTNQRANSRVEIRVDTRPFGVCQTIPTGLQTLSTAALPVICPVNTAELDTAAARRGRPLFPNGAHTLSAQLVGPDGSVAATASKALQFSNRNLLTFTTNITGGDSTAARGSDLTVTLTAVTFDTNPPPTTATMTAVSPESPFPLTFNQTNRVSLPATFTINPAASLGADGYFTFAPQVFDQAGNNVTSTFDLSPFTRPVLFDLAAPQITPVGYPPVLNPLNVSVVVLNYGAGIYQVGDTIPLSRITNGVDAAAHAPTCTYRHLHGNISIRRSTSTLIEGPYTDPQTTVGDQCGWGPITTVTDSIKRFDIVGLVADRGLSVLTARLYLAVGACDAGPIVDDVPVPQGTGLGQTPTPIITFPTPASGFSGTFEMKVDHTFIGKYVCTVVQASDKRVSASGQPAANTTFLVVSSYIEN